MNLVRNTEEITQSKEHTQKKNEKKEAPKTGRIIIKGLVYVTGVQEEQEKGTRAEKKLFFEEITAENVPNLVKHIHLQTQDQPPQTG